MPSAALRVGTTATGSSADRRDLPGGEVDVRVVGQDSTRAAAVSRTASRSSPVLGLADWPPRTMRTVPYSRKGVATSARMVARPSDGATATTPSGNRGSAWVAR